MQIEQCADVNIVYHEEAWSDDTQVVWAGVKHLIVRYGKQETDVVEGGEEDASGTTPEEIRTRKEAMKARKAAKKAKAKKIAQDPRRYMVRLSLSPASLSPRVLPSCAHRASLPLPPLQLCVDYDVEAARDATCNIERTQFQIKRVHGRFESTKIVRLANGFPSTKKDVQNFDRRQESNVGMIAKKTGITIKRAEDSIGARIKPNAPCPCGSGRKYKKCCRV